MMQMARHWSLEDAGSQSGRVAIVTGANTGLGYETALALAGKGARVILACRNQEKAEAAKQRVVASRPSADVEVRTIDTGSFDSVRKFADAFRHDYQRLDLLINNAGIMITPHFRTPDGYEGQFGVNYLGHFLLTGLLLPTIVKTPKSRIVSLYSVAANWGGIHFDDLQFEKRYDANKAYSQSKMACLMFALELNARLRRAGRDTIAVAAHPGFSQSDLSRHLALPVRLALSLVGTLFMQSAAQGALPTLYGTLGTDLRGGEAVGPSKRKETVGPPAVARPPAEALNADKRERLWSVSEKLCGIQYAF
jgi:NAD(P)-dependent dehydrogenase (short-subunit alcohol dehydrogenase family)